MKVCAKEARRLKSKIEFRRLMEKMKKRFLGLPGAVRSLRIFEEVVVDLVRRICKGWERRSSGKFTILLVFLRKRRRWAFSLFEQYASGLGSTNLSEDSSVFDFSYETDCWANNFVAQKSSEMSPLSGSSPVLFHNHLRLKLSSLLNVYLNCKFEISFLLLTYFLACSIFPIYWILAFEVW